MKNVSAMSLLTPAVVAAALLMMATVFVDRAWGQQKDNTMFPTPSGRYYNSYRSGPYGSYSQGAGSQFSAGSRNMFNQGGTVPTASAYDYYRNPDSWPNVWSNQSYGGQFHYRPMVGPAYDPFRNGR